MLTHKTREPLHVTSMSAKHEFYTKLVQVAIVAMNQIFLASNGLFAIFLVSSSKVDSISIPRWNLRASKSNFGSLIFGCVSCDWLVSAFS